MKVAISLPDELSERIDARARALKLTRSAFIAKAARAYLGKGKDDEREVTEEYNRMIEKYGQPGDDPEAVAVRRASQRVIREQLKNDKW